MISFKKKISNILLDVNSTLNDVIRVMNKTGLKIVVVTKANKKFLGTIVDGDIRRSLIKGVHLENKITKVYNAKPIVTKKNLSNSEANAIMTENYLNHLPVIDKNNKFIGLHILNENLNLIKRKNLFVIMAGGKGKRLLPNTSRTPKPLIKVFGKPMLEHIILNAKKNGFKEFVISVNYLKHKIKKYFKDGSKLKLNIDYIEEKKPLGTAGSLSLLKNYKRQHVVVSNCDVISNLNYGDVLDYHIKNRSDATMVVRRFEKRNLYGVIKTNGNIFLDYEEKPLTLENINTGIYVFNSKVFKYLKRNLAMDMTKFFLTLKKKNKKVLIFPIYENWSDHGQRDATNL